MNTPPDTVTTNTPRVALRAMEPEDLDWLYAVENNREVWNVGNTNVPYSRYVLHDYIANATNDIYNDGQVRLIVENEEHELIGMVDVFDFNAQHRRAEVSIVVRKEYRRKGYAAAAIDQILDYSLHILHLHTDKRTQRLKTNGNLQRQTDKDAEMTIVLAHKDEHGIIEHVHVAER